jgi:hypothetical protein
MNNFRFPPSKKTKGSNGKTLQGVLFFAGNIHNLVKYFKGGEINEKGCFDDLLSVFDFGVGGVLPLVVAL